MPVAAAGSDPIPTPTAWPVPRLRSCTAVRTSRPSSAPICWQWVPTSSRPCPTTTTRWSGAASAAACSAWPSRLRPPTGWSTFGVAERMRVPSPAARTTTAAGVDDIGYPLLEVSASAAPPG